MIGVSFRLPQLKFLIVSFLLGLSIFSQAQKPTIIPPSPEAAALAKFGDIPVSNYTGIPSISVPLYSLAAYKYTLPIVLNYHAGGVRVEEESGWVGLNWSLAGGAISRTIKGKDDLGLGGFPFAPTPNSSDDTYMNNVANGTIDSEPDVFFYNFPGKSGKFVLQSGYQAKLASQEKLKISYNTTTRAWTVVSVDGIQYIFGVEEITIPAGGSGADPSTAATNLTSSQSSTTTWHLTQIVLLNGDSIYFDYSNSAPVNYKSITSISQILKIPYKVVGDPSCSSFTGDNITYLASRTTHVGIYLQKIRYKNFYIDFLTENRTDLEPFTPNLLPQRLKDIKVYDSTSGTATLIKHFEFGYSYYNNSSTEYRQKRLKLTSVRERNGSLLLPSHSFEYYTSPNYAFELPAKNSASRDFWGYFNGKNNDIYSTLFSQTIVGSLIPPISVNPEGLRQITDTGADRNPDEEGSKLGVLKKIIYPTGGATELEYEAHQYYSPWTETVATPQNVQLFRYGPTISNPPTGIVTETTLDFSAQTVSIPVSIYAAIYCYNYQELGTTCQNRTPYYGDIYKVQANNTEVLYASMPVGGTPDYTKTETTSFTFTLPPGKYKVKTYAQNDAWVAQLDVSYNLPTGQTIVHNNKMAGGLRVASIKNSPGGSGAQEITNYNYEESAGSSSGLLMTNRFDFHYIEELFVFCDVNHQGAVKFLVRKSSSNVPIGTAAQGNHVGYSTVTELRGGQGANGKIEYKYLNEPELVESGNPIPDETTFQPNQNGLLTNQIEYKRNGDGSFSKVKSVEKQYVNVQSASQSVMGLKVYTYEDDGIQFPGNAKPYYFLSEKWNLTKDINTVFETDSKYVQSVTDYFYDNPLHFQITKTRATQSNGSIKEVNYKYPHEFQSGNAPYIQSMITANMIAVPLETTTIIEKSASDRKYVDAKVDIYQAFSFSSPSKTLLLPYKSYKFNSFNNPPASISGYNGSTGFETSPGSYYETTRFVSYDKYGNPTSLLLNNSEKISYLWAYKGQYPVAEIQNADNAQVLSALGGTSFDAMADETNSTTILSKINGLRTGLTSSLVTGYLYQPLVGMTQKIAANGLSTYYTYDGLQRLEKVKDNNNQTVKSYKYNYATP